MKGEAAYEKDCSNAPAGAPRRRNAQKHRLRRQKQSRLPQDFAICFAWWYNLEQKNSMDTATGKLQKDLLADGTASAEFQPDEELLQQLYELVSRDGFYQSAGK